MLPSARCMSATAPTGRLQSTIAAASAKFTAGKDRGKKIFKFMGKLATMSKSSIILLGKEFKVAGKILWKVGIHGHRYTHAEKLRLRRAAKHTQTHFASCQTSNLGKGSPSSNLTRFERVTDAENDLKSI
eukprot:gene8732-4698_t